MELVLPSSGFELSFNGGDRVVKLEIFTDPNDPSSQGCGFEVSVKVEDFVPGSVPKLPKQSKASSNAKVNTVNAPPRPSIEVHSPSFKKIEENEPVSSKKSPVKFASRDQVLISARGSSQGPGSLITSKASLMESSDEGGREWSDDPDDPFASLPEDLTRKHTNAQFDRFLTKNLAKSMRNFKKGNSSAGLGDTKTSDDGDDSDSFGIHGADSDSETGSSGSEGGGDVPLAMIEAMRTMTRKNLGEVDQNESLSKSSTIPDGSSDGSVDPLIEDPKKHTSPPVSSAMKAKSHHQFLCNNLAKSKAQLKPLSSGSSDESGQDSSYSYEEEGGHDMSENKVADILRAASSKHFANFQALGDSDDLLIDTSSNSNCDFPGGPKRRGSTRSGSAEDFLPSVSAEV